MAVEGREGRSLNSSIDFIEFLKDFAEEEVVLDRSGD